MPYSVTGIDLVSTNTGGSSLSGNSMGAKFSADGTKIVFSYKSSSGSSYDLYLKNLTTGTLTQITSGGNGDSVNASFNAAGTKIVFESDASNLIGTDTNGARDVFVYDIAGASITRASVDASGAQSNGVAKDASFLGNGSVIFTSNDSTLVSGDTNGLNDIFSKNLSTGEVSRISVDVLGQQANGEISHVSASNNLVGFLSTASNLAGVDTNGIQDLFVKRVSTGAVARVNTSSVAQQATNGVVSDYAFSPDGTKVVFASTTTNISGPGDFNGVSDIFVKNLITGQLDVVTSILGVQGNGASYKPSFSQDNTKVVFVTEASNFDPSDTNGMADVYMKDLNTGEFTRISIDPLTGDNGNGSSLNPTFHPINNTKIIFDSAAENLDTDGNNARDIFIATVTAGNSAPVAMSDTLYETENVESANLYYVVTANDFDAESGVHITNVITTATKGTVFFDAGTQTLTYTPEGTQIDGLREGQTGTDTFEYVIQDDAGVSRKGTVTVNIAGMNDDPNAVDDSEDANLGVTTSNLAPSLLSNDTDADVADTKKILSVDTTGTQGTITFSAINQTLTYNANPAAFPGLGAGQTAEDTFTYTIIDSAGATSTATVTMTVTGINHAPTAVNDAFDINEGATTGNIYAAVLSNDTDTDTVDTKTIVSVNASGLNYSGLSFSSGSQTLEYNATTSEFNALAQGEVASEVFTYTMRDTAGEQSTASVTVNITGVNDGPVADDDSVNVTAGNASNNITSELLAGDTDPDHNATLTITGVSGSAQASVSAGVVNYAANSPAYAALAQGQTTTDSFTYTLSDEHGATDTATVNVTITGVNDGPVSADDASSINEGDTSANLTSLLLSNDSDVDTGDTFDIISINTSGTVGTVDFSGGVLTYTATEGAYAGLLPGQTTTDTFTYTIQDNFGATSTSTVTMTITGVAFNDAPTAVNDAINATENVDTANLIPAILANDTDPDSGDTLRVTSVNGTGLTLGTLAFDDINQTLVYSPSTAAANALALGETATNTFTYTIADEAGETSTATATITVTGTNDGPVAVADGTTVTAGATTANLKTLVLSNDTDVDHGAVLSLDSVNDAITQGTVAFNSGTQTLTYTADGAAFAALGAGETATDIFAYTVKDQHGATSTANVTVTITGANDGPTAVADSVATTENLQTGNLVADLLANDIDPDNGDSLNIVSVNDAGLTIGALTFNETTQSLTYLADGAAADALAAGETHTESFTYTIEDESGSTSTATATVTLNGVNDGPVSVDDGSSINEGDTSANLTSLLLSNDSDVDNGDSFNITDIDTTGTLGEVSFTGGVLTYTATEGAYAGLLPGQTTTDTFTYTITDSNGAVSTSTVTMTITGVNFNDAPVANDDAINATENVTTANLVPVILANDTDADTGDTIRVIGVSGGSLTLGTLSFNQAAQTLTYSPNTAAANALALGETATDTFTYTIEDESGETSTATATITVTGTNDGPVANADSTTVAAGGTTANLTSLVLSNDTDVDHGAVLSVDAVNTTGTNGTVAFNEGTQTLTYTANGAAFAALGAGDTATDSFAYTVTDEHGATSTSTVTVTVTGANDGPVAVNDAVAATENVTTGNLVASLLSNDTDADTGDTLRIASVNGTGLALGGVTFSETTQTLTYAANSAAANALAAGQTATESFTYTIEDEAGSTSTATATVTLTGVNDGPVSADDASAVNEGDTSIDLTSLLLSNDSDVDNGDSFTITGIDTTGTVGEVSFTGGVLTYTATEGAYAGLLPGQTTTDTFTYTITDESGATSTSTVTMTITGVDFNDAPEANDDGLNATENVATANLVPLILANDTDSDNDALRVTSIDDSGIVLGDLTFNEANQTLVYLANSAAADALALDETTTESFTYTIEDESGETSSATATITLTGANDGPVGVNDTASVNAGASTGNIAAAVLGNDTDIDHGAVLSIQSVNTTGTNGTVSFNAGTQSLSYTASGAAYAALGAGQTAIDTFGYTVKDEHGATSTATVSVTVTGVNDGPTAVNDAASVLEDGITGNLAATLLANDTDPDSGDTKTITAVNTAGLTLGTVAFNAGTQTLTYAADKAAADTLAAGQTATDTFTYTMKDGAGATSTATVTMTVTGINDGPVAVNDAHAATVGVTSGNLTGTLLANDTDVDNGDTKAIASVNTAGTLGTVAFNSGTQSLTYTASGTAFTALGAGQTRADSFQYTMRDAAGATSTATVNVTVTGANDGPTAVNDTVAVNEDATTANLTATLLANDTDPDSGDTKSIVSVNGTGTTLGTVSFNAGTQTLTYAANKNAADSLGVGQTANDTFTYTMRDAAGATSTATVTVKVTGINDAPKAVNDKASVNEDATTANLVSTLLANDTDLDNGDTKSILSVNAASLVYGTVVFNASTQSLTYAANKDAADALGVGQTATDTFTYTMQDAAGATSTATVTMTIKGVNDAPIAGDDTATTNQNTALIINTATLLANDRDVDGTFTFNGVTVNAAHGTVVNNGNGTLTYTPTNGYSGTDVFTYSVKDNNGATDTAVVNLTIKSTGKNIKGTDKDDTLKGGTGNDTIEGGKDKGCVTVENKSYFLGTTTSQKLVGNDTDSNSSTIGWSKAWGQYTPIFKITAVGIGETEATGYTYSNTVPSFVDATGNAHASGIGTDGKANLGGTFQQEIGYDPRTQQSEKLVIDAGGQLISKAAIDLSYFYSKLGGADALSGTKYSEAGHWEAYKNGVLVGQGDFVAGVNDTNNADRATFASVGSGNNESLLTLDFASAGGFDKVVLTAKQYDGLNANQSAAAGKALGTAKATDSSDFMVRNVKFDMLEKTYDVKAGDHLYGGAGNDTFIFNKGAGVDVIHDFTDADIIRTNYKLTDVVTGFGTDTLIFKNGSTFEAIVADDNGHTWDASDFVFAV